MNEEKSYISVKEFAAAAGVSQQYIYKILGSSLKPYKKKIAKKTFIDASAIEYVIKGFPSEKDNSTNSTKNSTDFSTSKEADLQPIQPTFQPTNSTSFSTSENEPQSSNGEVEALKQLIQELKEDKEYLKQEVLKWQQLLADERNKVKLLEEAAAPKEPQEVNFTEVLEPAPEEQKKEAEPQELPKGFFNKLKWLLDK